MAQDNLQLETNLNDLIKAGRSRGSGGLLRDAVFSELDKIERRLFARSSNLPVENPPNGSNPGNLNKIQGTRFSDVLLGEFGADIINGKGGRDFIFADAGNDQVNGGHGRDALFGGLGNDIIKGGAGKDQISGGPGDDTIFGGRGNDVITYVDGDGNDTISGGRGSDRLEITGNLLKGNDFTLDKTADGKALFQRTGLDNLPDPASSFALTIDSTETIDVQGGGGNDTFRVSDLTKTGVKQIQFNGEEGNDVLDAGTSNVRVTARGGKGTDTLTGGRRGDLIAGGDGVDTLTGGGGRDRFLFEGDPFANGKPAVNAATGIGVLNQPDKIMDYTIGEDVFALKGKDLGIDKIKFVEGASGAIGNGNVINLTDGFANAAAAAKAIANNDAVTAKEGAFLYFNTTLGISRLVQSNNLAEGGNISVLANLNNQTVLANQANFGAKDFMLV
jgi:Ca2+-binding RTX toxin-like protein